MTKRILYLMSDTGGGHRAAAKAIAGGVERLFPGRYEAVIEDIWKNHTPWPINELPDTYRWLSGPGVPLWKFLWSRSANIKQREEFFQKIAPVLREHAVRYLHDVGPDLIVCVHPLFNHLGLDWLKHAGLNIPFVTVVTDLVTPHPAWICPQVTRCLVPTQAVYDFAIELGMPADRLAVHGQPVDLKFAELVGEKAAMRHKLGLDEERPAVLVVGGGEGVGQVGKICRAVARRCDDIQLLVVAGRNKKLRRKLARTRWPVPTHIFGYVDNMPELMSAADLLITKAGPGTICEAFIAGLPLILSGFIPGQETGNVRYVLENQAGGFATAPEEIAGLAAAWLRPGTPTLATMAANAAGLARPQAARDIAADICALLGDQLGEQTESWAS